MSIKLYHCVGSRSLRPLWTLEALELAYELEVMQFPPRFLHDGYTQINPLGTVPFFIDRDIRMTESVAICQYLVSQYGPTSLAVAPDENDYADYLNWMARSDATLTFPQTVVLRYTQLEPDVKLKKVTDDYTRWFFSRLRSLETALKNKEFLCMERFTIADICVAYALHLADTALGLRAGFKHRTEAYYARMIVRADFKRAASLHKSSERGA